MKYLCTFLIFTQLGRASPEVALSMVPRGKLSETIGRDYKIKTSTGTKIEIEFRRNGKLEEAKGSNLNRGDEFEPGEGLLSLATVARKINQKGLKPEGRWQLEEDEKHGWIYEFSKTTVDARSGKIIGQIKESSFIE